MLVALFPGQGSLRPGMGTPWLDHPAISVLDEVAEVSGIDLRRLTTEAPLDELVRTDNAQLATYALSLMVAEASGIEADLAIGHSLGEYSALTYAGILSLAEGTRLVVARGSAMLEASTINPGSLVAVLGASPEAIDAALAGHPNIVIANENAPGQTVLAGSFEDLDALKEHAKELGLRKVVALEVGGAFHSPLMAPAQEQLNAALATTTFSHGQIPVVANVDATAHDGDAEWAQLLSEQLTGTVRFASSVAHLNDHNLSFVELGPGGVLAGLIKRIKPEAPCRSIGEPDDLNEQGVSK